MKILFTFLTVVFLTNISLLGQCPDSATPNPTNRTFNMIYVLEADRDVAWDALASITFPAGTGAPGGEATITIDKTDLTIDGPVGADDVYRIRAITTIDDYFGGENGSFEGIITFNMTDETTLSCDYMTTSVGSVIDKSSLVRIFPNPVNDQLTLINGKGQAAIYNVLGQAVKDLIINDNQSTIQLSGLLEGQYYLRVLQSDGTIVIKQFSKLD